jgi:rare lipoprotein A
MKVNTEDFFHKLSILLLITTLFFSYGYFTRKPGIVTEVQVREKIIERIIIVEPYQQGIASYYSDAEHGQTMANGEVFNMFNPNVAAHATLPFGTTLLVTNLKNGRSIIVSVQDRLPRIWTKKGRVIDLSLAAGRKLDMISDGLVPVTIKIIKEGVDLATSLQG